jgi:hypothetical protein
VFVVAACSSWQPAPPAIDGWPLADPIECGAPDQGPDWDVVAIAERHLAVRPSDVVQSACFGLGSFLSNGERVHITMTGGHSVVVLTLADGTRRAVGIGCHAGCGASDPITTRP